MGHPVDAPIFDLRTTTLDQNLKKSYNLLKKRRQHIMKHKCNVKLPISFEIFYSESLNKEYIGRIYQMSSGQFSNEFYTLLRKFQYLRK